MTKEIWTYLLLTGVALGVLGVTIRAQSFHLVGNHQDYAPTQPLAFSHRLHAGEMSIDCQYCHSGAETSRHAGIPATSVCMNCHKFVTSTFGAMQAEDRTATEEDRPVQPVISDELQKLYATLGLEGAEAIAAWNPLEVTPAKADSMEPMPWVKVHNLPDFVYFDHRPHVNVGLECQKCHGNVETMERIRQVETLAMGWCVNCHRKYSEIGVNAKPVHAPIDCTTCHY
ncbi:MAG: cytochrome c3 family protein [Candidatus Hydrogenedentes bacterium]|nr:hypothetical protein [Candidatus Hydrogenedentota bacterium]MDK1020009.1 cytochrome c3 family protein [Candidatus Hydrogenedentota bacterium]